jgi:hypothetical protein
MVMESYILNNNLIDKFINFLNTFMIILFDKEKKKPIHQCIFYFNFSLLFIYLYILLIIKYCRKKR